MTTGTGEPPPPPAPPDSTNQAGIHHHQVHSVTVPENRPLPSPITTKQPLYTIQDSYRDFPTAPNERYMIQLHVIPHHEGCTTFHDMKWLDCIKHFLGIVKSKDDDFHILKKHGKTSSTNVITTQAQVPSTLAEFEQDFGFDIIIPRSQEYVKVKFLVASKYTFKEMFTGGYQNRIFKQIRKFGWWVNDMKVHTQGNLAQIGWLKYAHPLYTSQDDLLQSIRTLFNDITPHFDVICKWENRSYKTADDEIKKMRVRVLSLLCPRDIARTVSDIMFARWLNFNDQNSYWYQTAEKLRKYMFIPYRRTVQFTSTAQISHLLEHGQWLQKNNDVVYLEKIASLDVPFQVTQYVIDNLKFDNASTMLGTNITLRSLFNAWKKVNDSGQELPQITAIEQINGRKFALLTHVHSVYELYEDVQKVFRVMRQYPGWNTICGTISGAICTSPKVNPLLLHNAYLDSATVNTLGIKAVNTSTIPSTNLFNSNVKPRRGVQNPYKNKKKNSYPSAQGNPPSPLRPSNTPTSSSYSNAVMPASNAQQQPSSTTVTAYVTPSTLQKELQLLRSSFTDMAKSICTEVCTDMINPVITKIDNTHDQVHSMKRDLLKINELKTELKRQQQSLESKLDSKFAQILQALKGSTPQSQSADASHPTSTPNAVVTPPKSIPLQKDSSLQQRATKNVNENSDSESINFDYNLPSSIEEDEDDLYVGAMDVDVPSGTKRQSEGTLHYSRNAPAPPHTPPSTTNHYSHYTSQSITNNNSTNTMVIGAQAEKGSQKPSSVFIKSSALMTAQSNLPSHEHRKGSSL